MNHLEEFTKVASVNAMAFFLSFSDAENILRLAGLFVAFIYTCLKIAELIKNWKKAK